MVPKIEQRHLHEGPHRLLVVADEVQGFGLCSTVPIERRLAAILAADVVGYGV